MVKPLGAKLLKTFRYSVNGIWKTKNKTLPIELIIGVLKLLIFFQILGESLRNFTYIIADEKTRIGVVVDPSYDLNEVFKKIDEYSLKIEYIINTHSHPDHIAGNEELRVRTGAKVVMHKKSPLRKDIEVNDGDIIAVGDLRIKVIHTPGHTPDSICLLFDGKLLTGDTLFVGNCGRVDLPGGDAGELYDSLFNKLLKLDDDVEVYPGHDYGSKPSSTIGHERRYNYVLEPRTKEEFMEFMGIV
ncbi:MAG: MBL fold metallo-hydrolase [Nitrososphaerota archaeon]|nr:MBL fold metallo-hydrolase [Nitrososphaerota archaeon]